MTRDGSASALGTLGGRAGFEAVGFSADDAVRVVMSAKGDDSSGLFVSHTEIKSYLEGIRRLCPHVVSTHLLTLSTSPKGGTGLDIWDNQSKGRVRLQVDADGRSKLGLNDSRQIPLVLMSVAPDGARRLSFLDNIDGKTH